MIPDQMHTLQGNHAAIYMHEGEYLLFRISGFEDYIR